jgi:mono/diheme cytochrome c family protein
MRESNHRNKLLLSIAALLIVAAIAAFALHQTRVWKPPASASNMPNPISADASSIAAGKMIYRQHCVKCHGETGNGNTRYSKWNTKPADLTDSNRMNKMTDGELFWKISAGRRPMPAFRNKLTEQQRWQVVNYIRTFATPALPVKPSPTNTAQP